MKTQTTVLAALAAATLCTSQAPAQPVDCACASTYSVGDRVVALVNNPSSAVGLPAGTVGTVICGEAGFPGVFDVMVRWDGWTNGLASNFMFCDCPAIPASGTTGDWYVTCSDIEHVPVRNVTQSTAFPTLQAALSTAADGDVIEIDPVTLMEDGVVAPNGLSVTIRGAGTDQTIIDGMGAASASLAILTFSNSSNVAVSDLTFRNGRNDDIGGPGALAVVGTDLTLRDVSFVDNSGSPAHLFVNDGSSLDAARCAFRGSGGQDGIQIKNSPGTLVNCLAVTGTEPRVVRMDSATVNMLNCTVLGQVVPLGSTLNFTNSVLGSGFFNLGFGGTLNASRSLYAGATGDNIDGTPTFVDATGGDYRLAAGSLGIDAADLSAYTAAGGGLFDLGGLDRTSDDPGTTDTGVGPLTFLDIGAYEFQGASPVPGACDGDLDGDGDTDLADFTILGADFGCVPTP